MFVERIDVMVADGTVVSCSRCENTDLFHATLGGMGLTGIIIAACFRLVRVETSRVTVDYHRTADLDETLTVFESGDAGSEHSVAWIDCMASGRAMGRSVVMQGRNTPLGELSPEARRDPFGLPRKRVKSVPFTPPVGLLNSSSVRVFNEVFYAAHGNRAQSRRSRHVLLSARFHPSLEPPLRPPRLHSIPGVLSPEIVARRPP